MAVTVMQWSEVEGVEPVYLKRKAASAARGAGDLIVLSRVQLPEMVRMEELGEDVLSDAEQDEEWQWEEDSCYGYPCHPKAQQQVKELEDREGSDLPEGNRFHERSMHPFQDPNEEAIHGDEIRDREKRGW